MNEEDLRDCFAMFALVGLVMREGVGESMELDAWAIADKMMESREKSKEKNDEEDVGIARVAPKRSYKRRS